MSNGVAMVGEGGGGDGEGDGAREDGCELGGEGVGVRVVRGGGVGGAEMRLLRRSLTSPNVTARGIRAPP